MRDIEEFIAESIKQRENCYSCKESSLNTGKKTEYGATIIFKIGKGLQDGWFATLSPKTGGSPQGDFTIQLMPLAHLTHFSQIARYPELAKNYGVAFSKLTNAMTRIMAMENKEFKPTVESRELGTAIATYGKCTNWAEKKEHLHIKIFPFRGNIGQPYTVDSSFGRKKIFNDVHTGESFVKMAPVKKVLIPKERFETLSKQLVQILAEDKE